MRLEEVGDIYHRQPMRTWFLIKMRGDYYSSLVEISTALLTSNQIDGSQKNLDRCPKSRCLAASGMRGDDEAPEDSVAWAVEKGHGSLVVGRCERKKVIRYRSQLLSICRSVGFFAILVLRVDERHSHASE